LFETLKRRWAGARADVIAKSVDEILQWYQTMTPPIRYLVISAFEAGHSSLEDQFGELAQLMPDQKKELAKQVYEAARGAAATRGANLSAQMSRVSADGGALLSYFIELQTLPGDQAAG